MDLSLRSSVIAGSRVLAARGEIDMSTLPELHQALARQARESPGGQMIVDLDGVTSCDDAGLGVLLGCAGRVREAGGDLVVICNEGPLRARLTSTGFDRAVAVTTSVVRARRAGDESRVTGP